MITPADFLKWCQVFGIKTGGGGGVTPEQVQSFAFNYEPATGVNDAFVVNLTPEVTELTDGLIVSMSSGTLQNDTDSPTLQVNSLTPAPIVLWAGNVAPGDIQTGGTYLFIYNEALGSFQLINPSLTTADTFLTQSNFYNTAIDAGAPDAYVATIVPDPHTAPSNGFPLTLLIGAGNTNTGACTLSLNGVTSPIFMHDGANPPAGSIIAGELVSLMFSAGLGGWVFTNPPAAAIVGGHLAKNLIIGGNFGTNPWQRGTHFPAMVSGSYAADRWSSTGVTTADRTITRIQDAPTVSQAGILATHCLSFSVTNSQGAPSAGQSCLITQWIEGYNFAQIAQRVFTLSFWVKSNKPGVYCVSFCNSGPDRCYVSEYTINTADTWEKKVITVPASPSPGTWNYTNGRGISVSFAIMVGSTFQGVADTWNTGVAYGTANQVNGLDTNGNYLNLALVQVESGNTATSFEIRTIQEELALCQRYFWKTFPDGTAPAQNAGSTGAIQYRVQVAGVGSNGVMTSFPELMRATPTLTFYSPSAATANWYNTALTIPSGAASALNTSTRGFYANNLQVAGDNANSLCAVNTTANAEL